MHDDEDDDLFAAEYARHGWRNGPTRPWLRERARDLRDQQTRAERRLWTVLRKRGLRGTKFRRQFPIGDRYIVDFYCHRLRLVIELDGGYHGATRDADQARQQGLEARGYKVLRFNNANVLNHLDMVVERIAQEL